jgi:hypothetical protein
MKAGTIIPLRVHVLPLHRVMDIVHSEALWKKIDRMTIICTYATAVIGVVSLFTSIMLKLHGLSIVSMFSDAMAQIPWAPIEFL